VGEFELTFLPMVHRQLQSLIERVNLLAALREATEGGDRETKIQRKKRAPIGDSDLVRGEGGNGGRNKMARSMSASAPVVNGSGDTRSDPIQLGLEVAYRLPKQKGNPSEVEWIQCNVINIIGDGPKKKYVILAGS
jgi:hypothetical protein